jgi:hypothetical protein
MVSSTSEWLQFAAAAGSFQAASQIFICQC